jgi:hypothetical protein
VDLGGDFVVDSLEDIIRPRLLEPVHPASSLHGTTKTSFIMA